MNIKSHHIFLVVLFLLLASILYDYQTDRDVIDTPIIKLKKRNRSKVESIESPSPISENQVEESSVEERDGNMPEDRKDEIHVSDEQKKIELELLEEANKIKNEYKPFIAPKEKGQPWTNPYEIKSP
jgi:hypothetical protein